MDRSVDSIGSCSLDVDADSTDFSDTSGELNFLTPISGKDITREFTAGIKERCMLPVINCQAVTSVLDPVTGHISTVLTTTTAPNGQQQQQQALQPLLSGTGDSSPTAATNKKPSYLNLACCVNGYSNLTTYDSKLRQDINKSREVSPSRPIIATLHYNRTETGAGGHLLAAPTLSYVSMNNTINNNNNNNNNNYSASTGGNRMLKMNGAGVVNGGAAGRMRGMNGSILSPPSGGADMTDNVGMFNGNGSFAGSMRTKVISSQSQISSHARDEATAQLLMTPKKSFIQQRVEKLYGASEVVVLNKQNYSSSERKYLNNIANDNTSGGAPGKLIHHSSTAQAGQQQQHHHHPMGNGTARNGVANGAAGGLHVTNGGTNGGSLHDENGKQLNGAAEVTSGNDEADVESLPVLRHLRPEFRAQLQIFSPKKMPKPAAPPANRTTAVNGSAATHANGNTAEENVTLTTGPKRYTQSNGNSSNADHLEQQQHSLVREEQDHRTTVTNRSTMVVKNARISSHTTTTSSSTNGRIVAEEEEEENALLTSNHHHSNATSARSSTITEAKQQQHTTGVVTEQHHHETASQSRSSSTDMSTTTTTTKTSMAAVTSSTTVIVEEKMRSLVVVSPSSATAADNGVGRMSTADGGNAIATAAATVVPDEPKPTTVVAASVIENGVQNGVRQCSDTITNGLESVVPAVSVKKEEVLVVGGGEIVNCDNSSQFDADNMRTANGGSTVVMEPVAPSSITLPAVATMADFVHPVVEGGIQSNGKPIEVTTNGQGSNDSSFGSSSSSNNNIVLDGNHFLRILKTEQNRLKAMADEVEQEINLLKADGVEFGEDINGYILVAVGKARLLCSQKMKQFEDLCYTNLNQSPDEKFQTTGEDLRGFWDMVMLQVNNVDASFAEIDSFRKNGWRKPAPKSPPPPARNGTAGATRTKLVKRPYKTGGTANGTTVTDGSNGVEAKKASAALAAAKREAQRKQLMEMKRKQKLANSQQQTAVEIFAPASDEPAAQQNGVGGGDDSNCSTAVVPPVGTAAAAATTTLVDTS